MTEGLVLPYGDHPDQYVRCRLAQNEQRGTAVLVHGGYWRERHTAELMEPLVREFARRGWATVNVEYRRGAQAGWPTPLDDVRAACLIAAEWAESSPEAGPLIGVGHSVGGQLALLAGPPLAGVVALAPVTDTARVHREELGDGAAQEYFGVAPAEDPERYSAASPIHQLPSRMPTLLVHGGGDARVPLAHSLEYLMAANGVADPVSAYFLDRLSHLEAIDPDRAHWEVVFSWMDQQVNP